MNLSSAGCGKLAAAGEAAATPTMDSYASTTEGLLSSDSSPDAVPIDQNSNHSLISPKFPSWVLLPARCCRCCWMTVNPPFPSGSAPSKTFETTAAPKLLVDDAMRFDFVVILRIFVLV